MSAILGNANLRIAVLAMAVLPALAVPASAKERRVAPPGNSGISQYQESVPTASGNQPSNTIHAGGGSHGGGGSTGGGAGGAGGNGGGSGGAGGGSAVSPATASALSALGASGAAAANLARATAPSQRHAAARKYGQTAMAPPAGATPSPVSSVFKAMTGSSSSGGLGVLLPILLIVAFLGSGLIALLRRRRAT